MPLGMIEETCICADVCSKERAECPDECDDYEPKLCLNCGQIKCNKKNDQLLRNRCYCENWQIERVEE